MKKKEIIEEWKNLEPQNPFPHMVPIPPKHKGKTFGMSGIRIDGSRDFIMAVLSNLKPLLEGENSTTRLNVAMIDCTNVDEKFDKGNGGSVCYVRLHQRPKEKNLTRGINQSEKPVVGVPVFCPEMVAAEKATEEQLTEEQKLNARIAELEAKSPSVGFKISDDPDSGLTFDQFNNQNRTVLNE